MSGPSNDAAHDPPTWSKIYGLVGAGIGVAVTATWIVFWALIGIHSEAPHRDAVSKTSFDMLREDMGEVKIELRLLRQELNK